MEAWIVRGDAFPRQRALLDHRVFNVASYKRGQLAKFVPACSGGIISTDRIPSRKWSVLVDLLAVLRKWRHYQAPGDEYERIGVAKLHEVGDAIVASFTRQRKNAAGRRVQDGARYDNADPMLGAGASAVLICLLLRTGSERDSAQNLQVVGRSQSHEAFAGRRCRSWGCQTVCYRDELIWIGALVAVSTYG